MTNVTQRYIVSNDDSNGAQCKLNLKKELGWHLEQMGYLSKILCTTSEGTSLR